MKHQLPENFTARQAGIEDLPEIHRLEGLKTIHYQGKQGLTLDLLMSSYQTPGFEPDKSVLLIENQEGILVALVEVWDLSDIPVHPFVWLTIDPDYEGLGLEGYLLEWAEERAGQVLAKVSPELRVAMRINPLSLVKPVINALQQAGWSQIRHNFTMRIDMDEAPPNPDWPDGIRLRPYDPERDAREVFKLDDEVFQDHFGYVPEDFEQGYERFMHHMTGDESYDPSLWYLAYAGDELIAICICRLSSFEDPDAGHVSTLGVRRNWRRRGVAQALLLHAFGEFYKRGTQSVDLGVDAESLTGATDLYKKVGMHVHYHYDMHEKVLREGLDVSVNQLDEVTEQSG